MNFQQGEFGCWGRILLLKPYNALWQDLPAEESWRSERSDFQAFILSRNFIGWGWIETYQRQEFNEQTGVTQDTVLSLHLLLMTFAVSQWKTGGKCCAETLPVTVWMCVCVCICAQLTLCPHLPQGSSGVYRSQSRGYHIWSHREENRQGRGEGKGRGVKIRIRLDPKGDYWNQCFSTVKATGAKAMDRVQTQAAQPQKLYNTQVCSMGTHYAELLSYFSDPLNGLFYGLKIYWTRRKYLICFIISLLHSLVPGKKTEEINISSVFLTKSLLPISFCPY